jgi:hypothetical protein
LLFAVRSFFAGRRGHDGSPTELSTTKSKA